MKEEHEAHLNGLKEKFAELVDAKYRKGQEEHGGNLWQKEGIIDMALEEVLDMWVYLYTLKQQLESHES